MEAQGIKRMDLYASVAWKVTALAIKVNLYAGF
jgi:hypothetical protein